MRLFRPIYFLLPDFEEVFHAPPPPLDNEALALSEAINDKIEKHDEPPTVIDRQTFVTPSVDNLPADVVTKVKKPELPPRQKNSHLSKPPPVPPKPDVEQ